MARFQRGTRFFDVALDWIGDDVTLTTRTGNLARPAAAHTETLDPPVATHDREYRRLQSERLRTGWRRVRDPDRELDLDGEPRDPGLDAALTDDPADLATALVYADWLQQRGHPRGALIALQHARATAPDDPQLADAEARLFRDHPVALIGAYSEWMLHDYGRRSPIRLTWERGFVRGAHLEGPLEHVLELLWELLRHPSARFLRELELTVAHEPAVDDTHVLSELLLHAGPTPPLRRLVLGTDDRPADGALIRHDITGIGDRFPRLEELVLRGDELVLGAPALPHLRRLALLAPLRAPNGLAPIADARWPALAELALWRIRADHDLTALAGLAALHTLRAHRSDVRAICRALLAAPLAHELATLDLSDSQLAEPDLTALVETAAAMPRLQRLVLAGCTLPAAADERLERLAPRVAIIRE